MRETKCKFVTFYKSKQGNMFGKQYQTVIKLLKSGGLVPVALAAVLLCIVACGREEANKPHPLEGIIMPALLEDSLPEPERNKMTAEGVELGRILFYDKRSSKTGTVSCASCHTQGMAFADGVARTRMGVTGNELDRNSPPLINIAWEPLLFWEGGALGLENMLFGPLMHPDEMGNDMAELDRKLNAIPAYREMFKAAFGADSIESAYIVRALAQFVRTMVSGNSKYDKVMRREPGVIFTKEEAQGFKLYNIHCSECHSGAHFADKKFHNVGLDAKITDMRNERILTGRFRITEDSADLMAYRTPTLRNVAMTGPYMHDGRFNTLEEVMDFYLEDINDSPSLAKQFRKKNGSLGMDITKDESRLIIKFLHTLTDSTFLNNTRYSLATIDGK